MRLFLSLLLVAVLSFTFAAAAGAEPAERQNVLIIVADDLGYNDVGFQGSKEIPTPHLDALAARSLRCTQGYVNHAFCSPTRAALLTGRYQHRFGHEGNPAWKPEDIRSGLAQDQITLPQVMAQAGYATGMVGKWHLGAHPELHPIKRGFQEYYGVLGGGHLYFPSGGKGSAEYSIPMNRNGADEPLTQYLTTALGDEAAAYVQRHATGQPWLLYLAFNAPHTPLQAPEEWVKKMAHIQDQNRRIYAAMIGAMDEAIGHVLTQLEATQQTERTLIFFVSDNGGPDLSKRKSTNHTDNSPLRGAKGDMYEGGIRVPFLISLPGKLKPGIYTQPIIASDFFATAVALAGGKMPADRPMDSVDLMPYLTGQQTGSPHSILHWRTQGSAGNHALRQADWKLVKQGSAAPELYDLAKDIGEKENVAAQHPELIAELEAKRQAWSAGMKEPGFASPSGAPKAKGKAKK